MLGSCVLKKLFASGAWRAYRAYQTPNGPVESLIDPSQLKFNPHSIDVRLGHTFARLMPAPGCVYVDPYKPETLTATVFEDQPTFAMKPGEFALGYVTERFDTPPVEFEGTQICATQLYDGRSTCGRLGIQSHMTAGYGDLGFNGYFTLELGVQMPVRLHAGMRIGQISFKRVVSDGEHRYGGAYTFQKPAPTLPLLGEERFT